MGKEEKAKKPIKQTREKLTAMNELFVKEYLIDLNATQAAIRAGYSSNRASEIGYQLLQKTTVQKAIQKAMDARSKRTEITADRVLQEYAKLGFSDISDYLKVQTYKQRVTDEGEEREIMVQSVNLFDTDQIDPVKMHAVAEIKQTRDGIALKLHDKKGALDSIARHLGMFTDNVNLKADVGVKIINDIPKPN